MCLIVAFFDSMEFFEQSRAKLTCAKVQAGKICRLNRVKLLVQTQAACMRTHTHNLRVDKLRRTLGFSEHIPGMLCHNEI